MSNRLGLLLTSERSFVTEQNYERQYRIPRSARESSHSLIADALTNNSDLSFGWPNKAGGYGPPKHLSTPSFPDLINTLAEIHGSVQADTIFLFYYFGHGQANLDGGLDLPFGRAQNKRLDCRSLNDVVNEIVRAGVKKLILILDCCHAGNIQPNLGEIANVRLFALSASSFGRSYMSESGGDWTIALCEAMDDEAAVDVEREGITLTSWYEAAARVFEATESNEQTPTLVNNSNLGDTLIRRRSSKISPSVTGRRSDRTIYNRLYLLLRLLLEDSALMKGRKHTPFLAEIRDFLFENVHPVFRLRINSSADNAFIGVSTLRHYFDQAIAYGLVGREEGAKRTRYVLTKQGFAAVSKDGAKYNKMLVARVLKHLERSGLDREFLRRSITETMKGLDIPDIPSIYRKLRIDRRPITIRPKDLSFALRQMSYAGELRKNEGDVFCLPRAY